MSSTDPDTQTKTSKPAGRQRCPTATATVVRGAQGLSGVLCHRVSSGHVRRTLLHAVHDNGQPAQVHDARARDLRCAEEGTLKTEEGKQVLHLIDSAKPAGSDTGLLGAKMKTMQLLQQIVSKQQLGVPRHIIRTLPANFACLRHVSVYLLSSNCASQPCARPS